MSQQAQPGPSIEVSPTHIKEGDLCTVSGSGWPDAPVAVTIGGAKPRPHDILRGSPIGTEVRPDGNGAFSVQIATRGVPAGVHEVVASAGRRDAGHQEAVASMVVQERPRLEPDGTAVDKPYWRARDFFDRRFGVLGFVPSGIRDVQVEGVRRLRWLKEVTKQPRPAGFPEPTPPVPGGCNWTPVGPSPVPHGQTAGSPTQAVSGRALAIAIDPTNPATVLLGTAGGGVWKSIDSGTTWSPKSDHHISPAIGALAFDPTDPLRVLAGTGEFHDSSIGGLTYYGKGILRSLDGGETWTEHAGVTFDRHEISRIVFDPDDPTGQRVYLSASNGVFESLDNGQTWTSLLAQSASDLVAFVPTGPPNRVTLIAAVYGSGLWTSTRHGGTWDPWTQLTDPAFPATFGRIALGQCAGTPRTIYTLFASASFVRLVKTTNGGGSWSPVTVQLNSNATGQTSAAGVDSHWHKFTIPAVDLTAAPAAHTYTTTSAGAAAHTHTLSLTATQIETLASGAGVPVLTDADATGHQHNGGVGLTGQCHYNLHVSVKPDDANVVYLGEVQLWRRNTSSDIFELITDGFGPPPPGVPYGIHVDQHAFAFDPANPDIVWAANDGGVYRSTNGGNTWQHRNRDLQTLQYLTVSVHPTREAVMIAGAQDNGTHRYGGHPSWTFSAGGDGGFTQIDQATPTRMYRGYIYNNFSRSDTAGAPGSWVTKTGGIGPSSEFYPPFTLDPTNPAVCYFGGDKLWRSPNSADTWTAITNTLNGNLTAIAVHPADATTVYVGTKTGHVYRVQRTGVDWTLPNVTTTDLTALPLPTSAYISDLAVDTTGNVWVTFASVTWTEPAGEFTNDHVFRRDAATGLWEARVFGLAQANPVNTIVIDPADASRLFVGADVGVFRTENAGMNWTVWDEGLPNIPVFDLRIGPLRLMRAATHGRGVWERPIDTAACPMVDLYVRDNVLDTGRVIPSYDGVPHPFDPATFVHHWQSPDIKVDAADPAFQTVAAVDDYVVFDADLQHETARRTVANRFYAQVHNRGPAPATNVRIRAFFASAAMGLPPLPADFWTSGRPFVGTPSGPDWTPVGTTIEIPALEPAEPGLVSWEWTIPAGATKHSCLLVVTTCAEDPIAGGVLNPDTLVVTSKHVALKNLHVENATPGSPMSPEGPLIVEMYDSSRKGDAYHLELQWGTLPKETRVFVAFERLDGHDPILAKEQEFERAGIRLGKEHAKLFKEEYQIGTARRRLDLGRVFELPRPQANKIVFPRLFVPGHRPLTVAINIVLPKEMPADAQFDLVQRSGRNRIVGGSTYLLRAPERTA